MELAISLSKDKSFIEIEHKILPSTRGIGSGYGFGIAGAHRQLTTGEGYERYVCEIVDYKHI
jgi:hypothetical protein